MPFCRLFQLRWDNVPIAPKADMATSTCTRKTINCTSPMNDTGYFLAADLLGFGKIVKNSTPAELDARMEAWSSLVESTAKTYGISQFQLISDTIFVGIPSTQKGLISLLSFSRELLSRGIEQSFPLRGAIVHGAYRFGNLTYGRAVITAHELEQTQNWIGIACEPGLPHIGSAWSVDVVICYPVPKKRGPYLLQPAVSWPVPTEGELVKLLSNGNLMKEGEVYTWEVAEKASNTTHFRLHQEYLREHDLDGSRFDGFLPKRL